MRLCGQRARLSSLDVFCWLFVRSVYCGGEFVCHRLPTGQRQTRDGHLGRRDRSA